MGILNIPSAVMDSKLLPYLGWNDLLRFRRICKWTKGITDDYLKDHPELVPEIEISEEEGKNFRAFLKMGILTTRIFLNNTSGSDFYTNAGEDAAQFLKEFGSLVKHLRVNQLSFVLFGKELDFLEGLKNLESLEAQRHGGYRRGLSREEMEEEFVQKCWLALKDPRSSNNNMLFPVDLIKKLKTLKIGNNFEHDPLSEKVYAYTDLFLEEGKQLESFAPPFSAEADPSPDYDLYHLRDHPMRLAFVQISDKVYFRSYKKPPVENYKEVDFLHFHERKEIALQYKLESIGSHEFIMLACHCVGDDDTCQVKLMNVGSSWFMARKTFLLSSVPTWKSGIPVCSMVNIHPSCLSVKMPNLERIDVKSTSRSGPGIDWRDTRPDWPSLKILSITVDSTIGEYFNCRTEQCKKGAHYRTSTTELLDFFFEDVSRTSLTDLRLEFSGEGTTLKIPKTESLVMACPNLKKLTLVNLPGTNYSLTKLWSGLSGLEEVSLESCESVGDIAFFGDDDNSPVFLMLPKLKKLSLKGLDQMPKITDALFSRVIRHLKLTHFELTSGVPIKSVTLDGIRSLCEGSFAESIERFSFKNWSLFGVSDEEFKKLEASFRSLNMH